MHARSVGFVLHVPVVHVGSVPVNTWPASHSALMSQVAPEVVEAQVKPLAMGPLSAVHGSAVGRLGAD